MQKLLTEWTSTSSNYYELQSTDPVSLLRTDGLQMLAGDTDHFVSVGNVQRTHAALHSTQSQRASEPQQTLVGRLLAACHTIICVSHGLW